MKRRLLVLGTVLCVGFCSACGSNATTEEKTETVQTEETVGEKEQVDAAEVQQTEETQTEESEQSVAEEAKLAMQEGKYDEAIEILDVAKADLEVEEYALLMSNAYLYKEDYVAAADVLVETIKETDSQVLKDRLSYIRDNTLIVETKGYDEAGNFSYSKVNEYDAEGRLVKNIGLDAEGKETSKTEYTYDEKGNAVKEAYVLNDGSTYNMTWEYVYQTGEIPVSATVYDENGDIINTEEYDGDGNILLKTMYMDGAEFSYYKYEYDENGRETSLEFGYMTGEVSYLTTYQYEEKDGVIEKTGYDEEGNITATVKLDQCGNILYDDSSDMFVYENSYNSLNDRIYESMTGEGVKIISNIEYIYKFIGNIE